MRKRCCYVIRSTRQCRPHRHWLITPQVISGGPCYVTRHSFFYPLMPRIHIQSIFTYGLMPLKLSNSTFRKSVMFWVWRLCGDSIVTMVWWLVVLDTTPDGKVPFGPRWCPLLALWTLLIGILCSQQQLTTSTLAGVDSRYWQACDKKNCHELAMSRNYGIKMMIL